MLTSSRYVKRRLDRKAGGLIEPTAPDVASDLRDYMIALIPFEPSRLLPAAE